MLDKGSGPPILFVHGSAADGTAWTMQVQELSNTHRTLAYDRGEHRTVAAAVAEARGLLAERGIAGKLVLCGSSFGAVVALEFARRHPDDVAHMLLCEPPLPCHDRLHGAPSWFGCRFDALTATRGGPAAVESFLRSVLGDAVFAGMAPQVRERSMSRYRAVRADYSALLQYQPRYDELRRLEVPATILVGGRSRPLFHVTAEALAEALPRARLVEIESAGHVLHIDAPRTFNKILREIA